VCVCVCVLEGGIRGIRVNVRGKKLQLEILKKWELSMQTFYLFFKAMRQVNEREKESARGQMCACILREASAGNDAEMKEKW